MQLPGSQTQNHGKGFSPLEGGYATPWVHIDTPQPYMEYACFCRHVASKDDVMDSSVSATAKADTVLYSSCDTMQGGAWMDG